MNDDAVKQAEKIVDQYLGNMGYLSKNKKFPARKTGNFILYTVIFACVTAAVAVIIKLCL